MKTTFRAPWLTVPLCAATLFACDPALGPHSRRDGAGIAQVWVPAGSFLAGTSDAEAEALLTEDNKPYWLAYSLDRERPRHEVQLTKGYWIDQYEVTNQAFQAFVDAGGYRTSKYWSPEGWAWLKAQEEGDSPVLASGDPNLPRSHVCWYEAEAYAAWRGGRLPTEAEWEFAARGPESLVYPWGNDYDETLCNVVNNEPRPVGSYPKGVSWVGAYDMAGNLMEWVQDWYDTEYYRQQVRLDPQGPETGDVKIEKGGWFGGYRQTARSAYGHFEDPPQYRDHHIGFRIVSP